VTTEAKDQHGVAIKPGYLVRGRYIPRICVVVVIYVGLIACDYDPQMAHNPERVEVLVIGCEMPPTSAGEGEHADA
jgi:uncharacterized membrane protein